MNEAAWSARMIVIDRIPEFFGDYEQPKNFEENDYLEPHAGHLVEMLIQEINQ